MRDARDLGIMEGTTMGQWHQLGDVHVDEVKLVDLCQRYRVQDFLFFDEPRGATCKRKAI